VKLAVESGDAEIGVGAATGAVNAKRHSRSA
jgi:hypothetical protein